MPEVEEAEQVIEPEWWPMVRRELLQVVSVVAAYCLLRFIMDLTDENSMTSHRMRWHWRRLKHALSGVDQNAETALLAARGIQFTQVWLAEQFNKRKDRPPNGN